MTVKLLVRYGELSLKGKNRNFFEKILEKNIKIAAGHLPGFSLQAMHRRLLMQVNKTNLDEAQAILAKVFGIASFGPVRTTLLNLGSIQEEALKLLQGNLPAGEGSFKISTRRVNKSFPYKTYDINCLLGEHLLGASNRYTVDVHNPRIIIHVEIREKEALLYTTTQKGPGGLPVGVTGKGILLLSGGIDSPVAGWLALKRGVTIDALHFYSPPFTGEAAREKVIDLCRRLRPYGGPNRLYLAHFTRIQKTIYSLCPQRYGVILMRRMMLRLADKLAKTQGAQACFTGESLGQVASQTMESLCAVEEAAALPVLRPLIGMDKIEIINLAQKINTFPISIRPHEDCCTIFVPAHPATRPALKAVLEAEASLPVEELLAECLEQIGVFKVNSL